MHELQKPPALPYFSRPYKNEWFMDGGGGILIQVNIKTLLQNIQQLSKLEFFYMFCEITTL